LQHSETGTAAFAAKDGLVLRIGIMLSFGLFSFTVSLFSAVKTAIVDIPHLETHSKDWPFEPEAFGDATHSTGLL